jgi:RNA polymerase sigma factor (sigma-70 family)
VLSRGLTADEVGDVVRRYGALLERRCRLFMRDRSRSQDALQELFTTLLRRGEAYREAQSKYRWLCRAADRSCLDLLRREHVCRDALPIEEWDPVGPAPSVDPAARFSVLRALADLEDSEQALAIMLFVDGMSQGEAADELGVSRVTVNKRAQKIRDRLRISQDSSNRLLGEPSAREQAPS